MADYTYVEIDDDQAKTHDKALLAAQIHLLETIPKVTINTLGGQTIRNLAEAYALLRGAAVQAGEVDNARG
ncbi:hypothetical protein PUN71_022785 [Arthrobacter sp. NQ7]|uniref:hypothetical protein n=1 Tax=Arthrobacter sp. NQ7 TaxID=3032303 RepID=UPI00240EBD82|nr:hypothetical protein [Arthrobacter sp. NQ7]MDJ0460040.1 hypothetical protein [Arthrobacter sp. NQ7]